MPTVWRMGRARFLAVEDEPLVLRCISRALSTVGEVAACARASEAMAAIERDEAWTAVFLDVTLPDGSGLDLLRAIRARMPYVRAMVLTGRHEHALANTAHDMNAAYVLKPIEAARIIQFAKGIALPDKIDHWAATWRVRYSFSESEADVLRRCALGQDRRTIARQRGCSEQTVKKHAANLLRQTKEDGSLQEAAARMLREIANT
jgi:two-component system, NarL family, response regulator DevR